MKHHANISVYHKICHINPQLSMKGLNIVTVYTQIYQFCDNQYEKLLSFGRFSWKKFLKNVWLDEIYSKLILPLAQCRIQISESYSRQWYPGISQKTLSLMVVQKIKIVCLRWNLVPRLIQVYWIPWRRLLFLFWTNNKHNLNTKIKNCLFKIKVGTYSQWQNILLKVRKSRKIR